MKMNFVKIGTRPSVFDTLFAGFPFTLSVMEEKLCYVATFWHHFLLATLATANRRAFCWLTVWTLRIRTLQTGLGLSFDGQAISQSSEISLCYDRINEIMVLFLACFLEPIFSLYCTALRSEYSYTRKMRKWNGGQQFSKHRAQSRVQ